MAGHRSAGRPVIFFEHGQLVLVHGDARVEWIELEALLADDINSCEWILAAVAAAWALGMSPSLIGAGLRTFEQNNQNHR
jgi:cyanophycin synthetase